MKLLAAPRLQQRLKKFPDAVAFEQILPLLREVDPSDPETSPNVRLAAASVPALFVFRHNNWRIVFTPTGGDLLLLDVFKPDESGDIDWTS